MIDRRSMLLGALAVPLAMPAKAASLPSGALDAAHLGVRPGAPEDQSAKLQRAIDQAAQQRLPLWLAPGAYRAGSLTLPSGAQLVGARGATRLVLTQGPSLIAAAHADVVSLDGLILDGGGVTLPERRGLVHLNTATKLRIYDCELIKAGGNAIALEQCEGEVAHCVLEDAADNAIFSIDSSGLIVSANVIRGSGMAASASGRARSAATAA